MSRLQDAIGLLNDLVDVCFESHNCPDCCAEYKTHRASIITGICRLCKQDVNGRSLDDNCHAAKHKKNCRFAKAIKFLSNGRSKPPRTNERKN